MLSTSPALSFSEICEVLRALTHVSSTEETYVYCVCLYKFKNVSLGLSQHSQAKLF